MQTAFPACWPLLKASRGFLHWCYTIWCFHQALKYKTEVKTFNSRVYFQVELLLNEISTKRFTLPDNIALVRDVTKIKSNVTVHMFVEEQLFLKQVNYFITQSQEISSLSLHSGHYCIS